jgi:hypothetical protein
MASYFVELKGLVDRRAVNRRLHVSHDPEAILKPTTAPSSRPNRLLASEIAVPEVAVEAVRELKVIRVAEAAESSGS